MKSLKKILTKKELKFFFSSKNSRIFPFSKHVIKWYKQALKNDIKSKYCYKCGEFNLNFDDCGFFYYRPDANKAHCDCTPNETAER